MTVVGAGPRGQEARGVPGSASRVASGALAVLVLLTGLVLAGPTAPVSAAGGTPNVASILPKSSNPIGGELIHLTGTDFLPGPVSVRFSAFPGMNAPAQGSSKTVVATSATDTDVYVYSPRYDSFPGGSVNGTIQVLSGDRAGDAGVWSFTYLTSPLGLGPLGAATGPAAGGANSVTEATCVVPGSKLFVNGGETPFEDHGKSPQLTFTMPPGVIGSRVEVYLESPANACSGAPTPHRGYVRSNSLFFEYRAAPTLSASPVPWAVGRPFFFSFEGTTHGEGTFTVASGALPPGLTLESHRPLITGTATRPGTFSATIRVTDRDGTADLPATFRFAEMISLDAPRGALDKPYSCAVTYVDQASGAAATSIDLVGGELPPGLSWNAGTREVRGVPRQAGTWRALFSADGTGVAPATLEVRFVVFGARPTISGAAEDGAAPRGKVGELYSFTPRSTHAEGATFSVSAGALPPGIDLDPATGMIQGYPTRAGRSDATVTVTDNGLSADLPVYFVVPEPPTIATGQSGDASLRGTIDRPLSFSPLSTHAPDATFAVVEGALAPGLRIDPRTGTVSGTPTEAGEFGTTIRVTDEGGSADLSMTFIIGRPPVIAGVPMAWTVGTPAEFLAYSSGAEGRQAFSITAGALPPGMHLDAARGLVQGTPTKAGSYDATMTVTDPNGSASLRLTFVVNDRPPSAGSVRTLGAAFSRQSRVPR